MLSINFVSAEDWPRWRGLKGNGISSESNWVPAAIEKNTNVIWNVNVGNGWSSVSVRGNHLYTMGNVNDQDIVYCLDVETGKEIWRYTYSCDDGNYPGPRSTPVIDGDLVYTISREGHVFCLDAASGKVKWKRQVCVEEGAQPPTWGFAGAACIEGELALFNVGVSGIALNKNTGETVWSSGGGIGGYSTPVIFTFKGKKQIAIFGEVKLFGVDLQTGKVVWSYDWETEYHINASDPVMLGDTMFISSGYGRGCTLLQITDGAPKPVWENKQMNNQFSSSVVLDGYIYGIDGNVGKGFLRCLEWSTGQEKWAQNLGFGALIAASGKLIVLNERGNLYMVKVNTSAYQEIASVEKLLKKTCWTAPVLSNSQLYLRNNSGDLLRLNLSQ